MFNIMFKKQILLFFFWVLFISCNNGNDVTYDSYNTLHKNSFHTNFNEKSDYLPIESNFDFFHISGHIHGLPLSHSLSINANNTSIIIYGAGENQNGTFTLPDYYMDNESYTISIKEQPEGYHCNIQNGAGSIFKADVTDLQIDCVINQLYYIGGTLEGLNGDHLVVYNNGEYKEISENGPFFFATTWFPGSEYNVAIVTSPEYPSQKCNITDGSGIVFGDIINVKIDCFNIENLISGTISGNTGSLELSLNSLMKLTVPANSDHFSFPSNLVNGTPYDVTITRHPAGQLCFAVNNSGNVDGRINNIAIHCQNVSATSLIIQSEQGDLSGNKIYIYAYSSPENFSSPDFIFNISIAANSAVTKNALVQLPSGVWYLRAFRDSNKDSLPSLGIDPQSSSVLTIDTQNQTAQNLLVLYDTSEVDFFQYLNATMINQNRWNGSNNSICGGFYLSLEAAWIFGNIAHIGSPKVMMPNSEIITLLDDGGCGDALDNYSSSYDTASNDGNYSYGIDYSFGVETGTYTFFYKNNYFDMISIYKDSIDKIIQLSQYIPLENPTGEKAVKTMTPEIRWAAVENAKSYKALIRNDDGSYNNFNDRYNNTSDLIYNPAGNFALLDQHSYYAYIQAYDTDITTEGDYDSMSKGVDNFFITDSTGTHSKIINGTIQNSKNQTSDYIIYARNSNNLYSWDSSLYLSPDHEKFQIAVLDDPDGIAQVDAVINYTGTGNFFNFENRNFLVSVYPVDLNDNSSVSLIWKTPVTLLYPENYSSGQTDYPVFQWEKYQHSELPRKSYILQLEADYNYISNGLLAVLPGNTSQIALSQITTGNSYDLLALSFCLAKQGVWDENSQNCSIPVKESIKNLSDSEYWKWSISVITCDFNDYSTSRDKDHNGISDFTDCLVSYIHEHKSVFTHSTVYHFNKK